MKPILPSILLVTLLFATPSRAAVTFTITGTIQSADSVAFSVGETVTVTITTAATVGAPNIENSGTNVHWDLTTGNLWSQITVSDTTGVYNPATTNHETWLESGDRRDAFYLAAMEDTDNGFGLFRNGEEINYVDAFVKPSSLVAAIYAANPSVTPESTFINGIYDVSSVTSLADNSLYFYTNGYANEYIGQISTIQVSGAAVPETSTTILFTGAAAGFMIRRRRR